MSSSKYFISEQCPALGSLRQGAQNEQIKINARTMNFKDSQSEFEYLYWSLVYVKYKKQTIHSDSVILCYYYHLIITSLLFVRRSD